VTRCSAEQDHAVLCAQVSSSSAGTSATAPMQTCQVIAPACDARHRRFAHHSVRLTHGSRLSNLSGTKLDRCCLTTQALALSQETSGSLDRRARKFTAENIEKIKEWVARGVGRDEIADRLAVTPGSLTVTCSRLGISLRKISLAKGSGAIPSLGMVQRSIEHIQQGDDPARPKLTLVIQTQNRQAEFDLPLRRDLIEQLALEASVRGWTIGDLVGKIVTQVMEKNLDAAKTKMPSRGPRPARRPRRRALKAARPL
jgi:hypothetical protein